MDTNASRPVREIMSRNVAYLREEENLDAADRGMEALRFRHVPVVDGNKLVGLVTQRDLLRASVSELEKDHDARDHSLKQYFFVREIMVTNVKAVRPETPLVEALELMQEYKLGCLPVIERDGTLVGIVTRSDFLNVMLESLQNGDHSRFQMMRRAIG